MEKEAKNNTENALTIVGIGASAGGLAALKTFFSLVPENSGLAYVVVVHLSPEHKSALAELLQPHVKMPVEQVTETVKLEPNHVYVIPPKANLNAVDTHLRLSEMEEKRRERTPIDHFFRTMAKTHDGSSIGIILTGTGSDGSLGIKEIKMKNGLTLVQDPYEAEFDGMPQSAIATGIVDMVLPLAEIPPYVVNFASTQPKLKALEDQEPDVEERQFIQKIFAQVRARTGRDFTRYKLSTISRRLQRRMQLHQVEHLEDYLDLLRKNAEEVKGLSDDFLINVTSFFRDQHVFQELEKKIIPKLFDSKKPDAQLRVWSVGCASGEEAYSLAMLLMEEASRRQVVPSLQVFASDLHEHSLSKARDGFYPGDIEVDVSLERLRRFFTKEDGGYRVRKELREMVVFTPHNLLGDPPFSRIDLIVCRNLLIYLKRDSQKDIYELFHYALSPDGFLLLGPSEHLDSSDLFRTENKELCIYSKRNVNGPEPRLPVFPKVQMRFSEEKNTEKEQSMLPYGGLHQKMVERYAPPSLLLSMDYQVLHVSETAGRYLRVAGGELSRDVFKLIHPGIQMELRTVMYAARESKKLMRSRPLQISLEGQIRQLIVSVRVVSDPAEENVILVMFEEYDETPATESSAERSEEATHTAQLQQMEKELQESRQRLQAVIEEYETSREEMKASNEELQSANEELRSTLEELETSKEELQSVNEELTTVNQENRHKVEELGQLSDDLQNLLAATDIATLFLDKELRIMRFTPKLGELFNVRMADRGRPISDQTHKLGYNELVEDARNVLKKLIPIEREVEDKEKRTYLTRILPYRSSEDRIDGVVITFVDITSRKQVEEELHEAKVYAESIIETLHEPLLVLSPDLRVKSVNQAFYEHFEVNPKETHGRLIYQLGNNQWDIPELRTLLEDVLPENNVFNDFEVEHEFEQIGKRVMLLNARRLDHIQLILLGIRDITEWKKAQEALQKSDERKAFLLKLLHAIHTLSDALDIHEAVTRSTMQHFDADRCYYCEIEDGLSIIRKDASRQDLPSVAGEYPLSSMPVFKAVVEAGKPFIVEDVHTSDLVDENLRQLCIQMQVISFIDVPLIKNGEAVGILCITQATPRKWTALEVELAEETAERTWAAIERAKVEEALRESEERMRITIEAAELATWEWNLETDEVLWNEQHYLLFGLKPGNGFQTSEDFFQHVYPDDRERVSAELKNSVEKRIAFKSEFRALLEDGSTRWMSGYGRITEEKAGKAVRMSGVMSNINESKETEEALRESQQLYRALASQLPGGAVFVVDRDLRYLLTEGEALSIVGFSVKDFEGKTLEEVLEPELVEEYKKHYRQTLEGNTFRWEHQSHGRYFISHGVPLRNAVGEVYAALAVSYDLTEQKQIEEKLRQSEEHLRLILDSARDFAIFTMDKDRKVTNWNIGAELLTGFSKEEILGQSGDVIFVPEDRDKLPEQEIRIARKKGHAENERWHIRKDGSRFWGSGVTMPLLGGRNKLMGFLKIMRDNTERRQMEESLRKAKEQAEKSARVKEEFLSTMSHEVRTPLNAINGLTNLLLKKAPRLDQKENLNILKFSTQSLLTLVNDILDYSKIEAGKVELESVDYRLSTLLNSIRQSHFPAAEEKQNVLYFHIHEDVPDVLRGDPHKLAQVLNNLVSNAIKFTNQGNISLEVNLEKKEADAVVLRFAITDNGIGISKEKLSTIFEKFTQADSSTVRRYGGTGLGLSITQSLLQLMGSDIAVESKEAEGSLFYFIIRQQIGNEENIRLAERIYTGERVSRPWESHFRKVKILLVEDADVNRMVIQQHLQEWWELQADEAANGKEAIEKAQTTQYELILMDKRMPEMDGIEATQRIRELNAHYAQVPIIIITADTNTIEEAKKEGSVLFNAQITKPFEPEQLMEAISSLIDLKAHPDTTEINVEKDTTEANVSGADLFQPDFAKAEKPFQDSTERKQKFYTTAIHSLQTYQADFLHALEQEDAEQLENVMHKAKMMFNMLGLEAFYQHMFDVRQQIEAGTSAKKLSAEIKKIQEGLNQVLSHVRRQREALE